VFDRDSDWFFLRLDQFKIEAASSSSASAASEGGVEDLEFEFSDCSNPNLKRGVIFDFIELREIVSVRTI
jgi:hypothetical protein